MFQAEKMASINAKENKNKNIQTMLEESKKKCRVSKGGN